MHVGHHQYRRRVLVEAIGHLLQRQTHVLEADLLADDVERHGRKPVVHRAHQAREDRTVSHAGVEDAQRRRPRLDAVELELDALRDDPLLGACADKEQIFLAVVVEAKTRFRVGLAHDRRSVFCFRRGRARKRGVRSSSRVDVLHESVHALDRLRRHPPAKPQAGHELAVVDRAPAERALSHAGALTERNDLGQERVVVAAANASCGVHAGASSRLFKQPTAAHFKCRP